MVIYAPYTYLIGWSRHNKWYYGARYARGCHPSDLWVTYFTSSKRVKIFRKKYSEPDVIQIRKVFKDPIIAGAWEAKVLQRLKAAQTEHWLNKCNSNNSFCTGGSNWYTNGKLNFLFHQTDEIPEGFRMGRTFKRVKRDSKLSDYRWYTNDKINIRLDKSCVAPEGFRPGRKKFNLTEQGRANHVLRGKVVPKDTLWYTDGKTNLRLRESDIIPPEFVRGVTVERKVGWYTNGIINICLKETDNIPSGFKRGRTMSWFK